MRGIVFVSCVVAALAAGCGGGSAQAPAPQAATPAPQAFASLTILLKPSRIAEVNNAAQSALVAAGYNIAAEAHASHNAVAELTAIATEIPSVFQVRVNGVAKKNFRINVTLVLRSGSRVIDQFSTQFEAEGGQVDPARMNAIVSAMNTSERVKGFAAEQATVVAERDAAAKAKADDEAAKAKARADDEAAKKAADQAVQAEDDAKFNRFLDDCRTPKNAKGCDDLKSWYQQTEPQRAPRTHRSGADMKRDAERRIEAGKVLEASKPAITDFADEEAWSKVNAGRCALGGGDECGLVSRYLSQFPTGKHVDAAKKALADGERVRAERDEGERKEARAEERAQAARAQQASCKSKCASETCIAYTAEDKKAACVAQCLQGCK